jgi:hypothetical protein
MFLASNCMQESHGFLGRRVMEMESDESRAREREEG